MKASRPSFVCGLVSFVVAGCYQPVDRSPLVDASTDGASAFAGIRYGDAGSAPACDPQNPSPLAALTFRVRTTELGGRFAPKNVGAIWIERADGTFVRTLEVWATTRRKWLLRFLASSGGNTVDAVTGATLKEHATHEVEWDLRDSFGCPVEQGGYAIVVEMTDKNAAGTSTSVSFSLGASPTTLSPTGTQYFHDLRLTID